MKAFKLLLNSLTLLLLLSFLAINAHAASPGVFVDSGQRLDSNLVNVRNSDVALGDLDGDGDLDAFVANDQSWSGQTGHPNQVWLNDGTGNFINSGQALGTLKSMSVALGDLDGDYKKIMSNF